MKELYKVHVYGESEHHFEEYYSEEEIDTIMKFLVGLEKHNVPHYDSLLIEFEKDGKTITTENYLEVC